MKRNNDASLYNTDIATGFVYNKKNFQDFHE